MTAMIQKRDGRVEPFSVDKIAAAIFKAAQAVGGDNLNQAQALAEHVVAALGAECVLIESIQDEVERQLILAGHAKTAKAYILYRANRQRMREMNGGLMQLFADLASTDAVDSDLKRENANIDADTAMGTMLKYGSEAAKKYYDLFVLQPQHAAAHQQGDIHIHDLDFLTLTTTCCQIDLAALFANGFGTGHGFLRSPQSIHAYAALACIAIQSNQNDQHGGQSVPMFDFAMAAGVDKTHAKHYADNLNKALSLLTDLPVDKVMQSRADQLGSGPTLANVAGYQQAEAEILQAFGLSTRLIDTIQAHVASSSWQDTDQSTYQAMEAFIHNLNTMHSRAGAQIPFSSINYGTDTSAAGRMVMRNLLLATERGLGQGETAIFPIQIFKVKDGVNGLAGDPNHDLLQLSCRVSAKRLFPNFSFLDAPFNAEFYQPGRPETEVAYMGCRTRVMSNVHDPERAIVSGRGNLSFTTINLPRLGLLHRGDVDAFYAALDQKIDLVVAQLWARYQIQAQKKVKNFPFLMGQGVWLDAQHLGPEDRIGAVLKHGTLTVGFIGLAECLTALGGKHHGESVEAQRLGLAIVGHMRARMDAYAQQYGLNYSLIATPAEGTAGRFVKMDRQRFGSIAGVTDRDYYTNSFHVPVYYPMTAFAKINVEAPYHGFTNGGHITYVELDGDPSKNLAAFEKIIQAMKQAGIGYGSINHPVDRDPVCGFSGVIDDECPQCGRTEADGGPAFERIRRITGYLVGTLARFNDAKRAEERDRVKHQ
ncbi:MAG: anaerobic ribonucleoside triphosphate reductase [Neisseriaceae bacterium]|nr:anaerobic ribonucleoside triphosphate reductase [Neisseriaceae bacterium]